MLTVRKSNERGHANHGWLDSYHTFSFASYYDPKHMSFRSLRVINEDRIDPGAGFATHGHRDMEIITYVLNGALEHQDSLGTGSVIRPGEVQHMSAGTGIQHSEYNHSPREPVHLLQIWITPNQMRIEPRYAQREFPIATEIGKLHLVAGPVGEVEDVIPVQQDMYLYAGQLAAGDEIQQAIAPNRYVWIQVVRGEMVINQTPLQAGDGVAISEEDSVTIAATTAAELLLFDLP